MQTRYETSTKLVEVAFTPEELTVLYRLAVGDLANVEHEAVMLRIANREWIYQFAKLLEDA